ncbi:Uncharacterised protein [Vibrio cholerae]|uniref:Uncharacterized protein n=1 Tax=Vibrio cholerae TaxID=666 RepID=A0A655Q0B3_VIBCL|nr:Uncharacterised protein [Vibrio cholerae]
MNSLCSINIIHVKSTEQYIPLSRIFFIHTVRSSQNITTTKITTTTKNVATISSG